MAFVSFSFLPPRFSLLLLRSWHRILGLNVWQQGWNSMCLVPEMLIAAFSIYWTSFWDKCTATYPDLCTTEQTWLIKWSTKLKWKQGKWVFELLYQLLMCWMLSHAFRLTMGVKWEVLNKKKKVLLKVFVQVCTFWSISGRLPAVFSWAAVQLTLPPSSWSWRLASGRVFCFLTCLWCSGVDSGSLLSFGWVKKQHTAKQEPFIFINQTQIWLSWCTPRCCLTVNTVTIPLEASSWFVSV